MDIIQKNTNDKVEDNSIHLELITRKETLMKTTLKLLNEIKKNLEMNFN